MKKVKVRIKGVAPLLHHRFPEEEHGEHKKRRKKQVYIAEEEAKKALYHNEEIGIYQPSEHILGSLIRAGVKHKFEGRKTFKDVIKGGLVVEPDCIPLETKNSYTIDARNVVVQRARIMRWRPRFEEWELEFELLVIDEDNIPIPELKEILETAGNLGIGDYRPRFGRFMVTEFKEIEN